MNSPDLLGSYSDNNFGSEPALDSLTDISSSRKCYYPTDSEVSKEQSSIQKKSLDRLSIKQSTRNQPRMSQLESLEARMANIEVSLSSTPRRKKNGSLSNVSIGSSIRSIPKEFASKEYESLRTALRDKENIIKSLKGQLNIPTLRLSSIRKNGVNNNNIIGCDFNENEKKQAEDRLTSLKSDIDNKRLTIKNLKVALERLDITDNIDVRIQQAELEYQLGREELNLLTLLEEIRELQLRIEENNKTSSEVNTLYSGFGSEAYVVLHKVKVMYDPKTPKFSAGMKNNCKGLWIEWALEETGLCKGDRLVEVNGRIVLTKTREDLARILSAGPCPVQIVAMRKSFDKNGISYQGSDRGTATLRNELQVVRERAEEALRAKEGLRSDNIRLTHRILYLEEQVSELLNRKSPESDIRILTRSPVISTVKTNQNITNINITAPVTSSPTPKEVVYQKGPQVTKISDSESKDNIILPIRSKSSLSNVSSTHIPPSSPLPSDYYRCQKSHRHKHRSSKSHWSNCSTPVKQNENNSQPHHHHHREKEHKMPAEIRFNKKNEETNHEYSPSDKDKDMSRDLMDQSFKKATKIVQELTRKKEPNLYEKHRRKCSLAQENKNSDILWHYNARKSTSVLDFRSEIHIGPKYVNSKSVEELDVIDCAKNTNTTSKRIQDSRSVKSLDFDSDCNSTVNGYQTSTSNTNVDYTSEPISNNNRRKSHYSRYSEDITKPRPTPPKKPLRLSLHKTQSLQTVDTSSASASDLLKSLESRKRNYNCISLKSNLVNGDFIKDTSNGQWC